MKYLKITLMVAIYWVSVANAADRLELDNTAIVGSRELPKVLYIVPWKNTHLGELSGINRSGSFAESMEAIDPEEFDRQLQYYGMLNQAVSVQ